MRGHDSKKISSMQDKAITRIDELIKKLCQTISECRGLAADESNIGINPTLLHSRNFIVLGQN
jgi:hypothetical protein